MGHPDLNADLSTFLGLRVTDCFLVLLHLAAQVSYNVSQAPDVFYKKEISTSEALKHINTHTHTLPDVGFCAARTCKLVFH